MSNEDKRLGRILVKCLTKVGKVELTHALKVVKLTRKGSGQVWGTRYSRSDKTHTYSLYQNTLTISDKKVK